MESTRWDHYGVASTQQVRVGRVILEHERHSSCVHHQSPPHRVSHAVRTQQAGWNRFVIERLGRARQLETDWNPWRC